MPEDVCRSSIICPPLEIVDPWKEEDARFRESGDSIRAVSEIVNPWEGVIGSSPEQHTRGDEIVNPWSGTPPANPRSTPDTYEDGEIVNPWKK